MKFNELCAKLGIQSKQPIATKLKLLQQWFQEHVSRDVPLFENKDPAKQFERYEKETRLYLEHIEPELSGDISKPNPKFDEENLISVLTQLGFDQTLLALHPDKKLLNAQNANGFTPLHQAAVEGHYHTVQALLSMGADTRIVNKQKQYPSFSALSFPLVYEEKQKENKIEIFKLLDKKGNQPNHHRDESGNTILHQMALHGLDTLIAARLKTDPELAYIKNNHTHYPIHVAILNNQLASVIPLLQIKDGSTLADSRGWMAIHYAALDADQDVLEECCKLCSNINARDRLGRTPLMLAAEQGRLSAVQTLIKHKADVHLTDAQGFTLLHHAIKSGNLEEVSWLLENTDVDVNAKDNEAPTPLQICESSHSEGGNMKKISALLVHHGATTATSSIHYK